MTIYSGSTKLFDVALGATDVKEVYVGATKVFPEALPTVTLAATTTEFPVAGGTIAMTATPGGAAPFEYHWQEFVPGGDWVTYELTGVTTSSRAITVSGTQYRVVIRDAYYPTNAQVISNALTGTLHAAPTVTTVASPNPAIEGSTVTFTATPVGGYGTITYQWYYHIGDSVWIAIAGATAATYQRVMPITESGWTFTCNVADALGQPGYSSTPITMTINAATVYDPLWDTNTGLLLHFDTSDGLGGIKDEKGNAMVNAAATFGPDGGPFPAGTYLSGGSVQGPLGLAAVNCSVPYTQEWWIYPHSTTIGGSIFYTRYKSPTTSLSYGFSHDYSNMTINIVGWDHQGTEAYNMNTGTILTPSVWQHLAISHNGAGVYRAHVNGVVAWEGAGRVALWEPNCAVHLNTGGGGCFVDEFRQTGGVARYWDAFTPPANPFGNPGVAASAQPFDPEEPFKPQPPKFILPGDPEYPKVLK